MLPNRKKSNSKKASVKVEKTEKEEEEELEDLKREVDEEFKVKEESDALTNELEKSVAQLELNVFKLESGNYEYDDSEIKQKYDNQKQLNQQLNEQKRWLEHELEEIKQKIQNDKQYLLPDPFMMDWDNLSENELKRLVAQLEKTKSDVLLDLREAQLFLDHEGKEFHHYDYFCQIYQAEIVSLNRTLDSLMRSGLLPSSYHISSMYSYPTSLNGSFPSTGVHTPGPLSPKKTPHSPRKSAPLSPRKTPSTSHQKCSSAGVTTDLQRSPKRRPRKTETDQSRSGDQRSVPIRKMATVRNLPKIERKSHGEKKTSLSNGGSRQELAAAQGEPENVGNFLGGGPPLPPTMTRKALDMPELDTVEELPTENQEEC